MSSAYPRGSCANEYIQVIGRMMYDEPIVVRVSHMHSCAVFGCILTSFSGAGIGIAADALFAAWD